MNGKKLHTLPVAALLVVAVAMSAGCRGGNRNGAGADAESASDMLSANMALLDSDQVPDYKLATNDSLLRFDAPVIDLGRLKIGQKKMSRLSSSTSIPRPPSSPAL